VVGSRFRINLLLATGGAVSTDTSGIAGVIELGLMAGDAFEAQNGLSESIELGLTTGEAFGGITGLHESIELVLDAGAAIGDVQVGGVDEAIELTLTTGPGSVASAPGINEAIELALVGGAADDGVPVFDFLNPANIGQPVEGGFFAGLISHTADGVPTHALIVAPAATGASGTGYTLTTNLQWKINQTFTAGATSTFDGAANTAGIVAAGISDHPAAQFCVNLSIGGFTDWYLPADLELDIAYFHLKPTTANNVTFLGANDYSVPKRTANYTTTDPGQTTVSAFQSGQPEAFTADPHLASRQSVDAQNAPRVDFASGLRTNSLKTASAWRTRAFRRVAL
jgi:hypothetical protein